MTHKPPRPEPELPAEEYRITIYKISPKHHYGLRYEAVVEWEQLKGYTRKASFPAWTKWGARKDAEDFVKKERLFEPEPVVVEEYRL